MGGYRGCERLFPVWDDERTRPSRQCPTPSVGIGVDNLAALRAVSPKIQKVPALEPARELARIYQIPGILVVDLAS